MNLKQHIQNLLGLGFDPAAHALPSIYGQRKAAPAPAQTDNVRYYASGQPYKVEAEVEVDKQTGMAQVVEWDALLTDKQTGKVAGRSPLLTDTERAEAVARGFKADTAALVKRGWADGMSQSAISLTTGFSLDTVKRITPLFGR
jgi:hypothetical protein